jgi:serine/threonine protein kinase/Tol biopolymer transport system component
LPASLYNSRHTMALSAGTKLGPYEIIAPLGAGGMGEVYRSRDTRLGRDVAIKVLPPHLSASLELKERFDREARAISSLNHARICTLHDVGHQDGVDFLVMEYLLGESLAERLRKGALPLKETLKVAIEICEALDVAHRAGIVHRDLKPANVMLTKSGAKLMDFGLAKSSASTSLGSASAPLLSAAQTMSGPSPMSPLTTAGQVIGTIQYMSPEQIEGKEADARSDIFALGAVMYEMATAKRPFQGKSQISLASAILEKDPEPISRLQPLTPPSFERLVNTCLAKNPDDRLQSARDVRLELLWCAEAPSQVVPLSTPPPKTIARVLPWAIAALLALALGSLPFFLNHQQSAPQYTTIASREGVLQAARFSHDGQTILYSGRWEGEPPQLFTAHLGSSESRALGIPSATLASVSSSDQLAVIRGCEVVFSFDCGGTLATVSLGGGAPRDMAGHIAFADWSPDGKQLVVSKISYEGARLELPPGHVLIQQRSGWFGHPRFSPDGTRIAFENHPSAAADDGTIDIVDLTGKKSTLAKFNISLEGLAWSPGGREVWFAAASSHSGWADSIRAVTLDGKERTVLTMPSVRLHDISTDGHVLLSHENWRRQLVGFFPGDKEDHPYSWMDDTAATAITVDGRLISFTESGEVYYIAGEVLGYYRATDGSPAVSIGPGATSISPDGKWIALASHASHKLLIQPVGLGEILELSTPGLSNFANISWSEDGRFITYVAQDAQNQSNVYVQSVAGGSPSLIQAGAANAFPVLSPDGSRLALHADRGGISLYGMQGAAPLVLRGVDETAYPVRFINGGKSLLVGESTTEEVVLTRVDLADGHRTPWKRFKSAERSGLGMVVTPDLKYYTYTVHRYSSDLYVVSNLH